MNWLASIRRVRSNDFPNDPYKWAGSAALHILVGLVAVHALHLWLGIPAPWSVSLVALCYLAVIEVWGQGFRLPMDSLLDALMVLCGGVYAAGAPKAQAGAIIVGGLALAAGAWRRAR